MSDNNRNWILNHPPIPQCIENMHGLGAAYFTNLKKYKNRIAQIDAETGEMHRFGDILLNSICAAQEMIARGITSDDVISVCSHNHMQTFTPIVAATYLLAKVASLDPSLGRGDMKYMLNLVKPRMIFCDMESVEPIETCIKETNINCEIVVFGETEKHIPFKQFLVVRGDEDNFKPKIVENPFETAFIFFSSGTTGLPKGICLHHYGLQYITNLFSLKPIITMNLGFTTPYWISSVFSHMAISANGACRLICKAYDEKNILNIIEKFKVTQIFLPPALTYGITTNPNCYKYDTSSLKVFYTGGSTIAISQIDALQKIFPNAVINLGYGLTELCGSFSGFHPRRDFELLIRKKGSSGKMMPGLSCKVVDPETNEILGPNQQGELLVKSKFLMNGYYNNPEETKRSFDEDGFFRTGDIVYFDKDECFYVVDRIKEMFKFRSWHILPAELESIILTHPAIQEAIVIGLPHEEDGDRPMAVVVLKDGAQATEQDIVDFFNKRVDDRKRLRAGVKFVKSIPQTTTGKYNRRAMRNMIINNPNEF